MNARNLPDNYPLISAAELQQALVDTGASQRLHVLDCRFELANPAKGPQDFDAGHVPGARYVHIDHDLCAEKTGQNGRHPLPDFFEFVVRTQTWGLKKDDLIIAMDAGNSLVAGRLWWMLRWAGYPKAKVLDGGWAAWLAAGGAVEGSAAQAVEGSSAKAIEDSTSTATRNAAAPAVITGAMPPASTADLTPAMQTVDVQTVVDNLDTRNFQIIDGRDPERFTGARDTMDPVAGHIPGAHNRNFTNNLNADGTFKSADILREEFTRLLGDRKPDEIVHSCGSGVTACSNLLAMEVAGLHGSRLYPGSWSEYCADPSRPIAKGP